LYSLISVNKGDVKVIDNQILKTITPKSRRP